MPNSALKLLSVCALIFSSSLSSAHAQSAPDTSSMSKMNACPIIKPLPPTAVDDAVAAYDHYLQPAMKIRRIGGALIDPSDVKGKIAILNETYALYKSISSDIGVIINFKDSIRMAYGATATFTGLNTEVALMLLAEKGKVELIKQIGGSPLCIAASQSNKSQFEINFYGVKKADCNKIFSGAGPFAVAKRVNGSTDNFCEDDHIGLGRKFYHLVSRYGRNQVTFVFAKY